MTRKRFVKMMMGQGFSRNAANHMAERRPKDVPYEGLYRRYGAESFGMSMLRISCEFSVSFKQFADACSALARHMANMRTALRVE